MNGQHRIGLLVALLAGAASAAPADSATERCLLITGARVADGSGGPLRSASVEICGDRIARLGEIRPSPRELVLRAEGLVLAPGFIDIHNHSTDELLSEPLAETQISQGITTVVQGPDGGSPWPIADYLVRLRDAPPAVNVMTMVGHATVRELVMGDDYRRAATDEEVAKMAALVEQGMREGAAGLSSGLEYDVGSYSKTEELVALARDAAKHGGFYMTHIRDEADKTMEAFAEAIAIGRQAPIPVQISHIKLGTVGVWGKGAEAVALFEKARAEGLDVTADCYPYEAWHSNMEVLVPNKKYDDPASVQEALADVGGPARITITECEAHPDYENRTMEEIARSLGITPVELYIRMVKEGGAGIIGHSMREEDVRAFYVQPWVMVGSDGGIDIAHPRGAGTFPKVLGRYVREKRWFGLTEAIRKMTSLPAKRLKLEDRGLIREGMKADLVLFDPETVIDRSTFEKPQELAAGIRMVFVNGEAVWRDGVATGARPGRVLAGAQELAGREPGRLEPGLAEKIDAVFTKLDRRDSPGCTLAVIRDGRIVYEKGYGMASLELGVANTPDTVFDIGSTEKQFAATAILLLAQDGKLSIDDSVRKHVPELPRYADPVTIRHLLHHTGGLPDYISMMVLAGSRYEDVTTEEDALRMLVRAKAPEFPPGTKHSYSNSGYFLLSVVVRRVSGKSLREFAAERIFRPLGMSSTEYLDDHTQIVSRRSTGYSPQKEGGFRLDTSNWEQNGDGGLQTTVRDLAKWDQNFYAPAVGGAKLIEELQTTGTLSSGKKLEYAKGLRVDTWRGLKRVSHGGAWAGYRAQLVRFPQERVSAICLCNLATAGPSGLANKVVGVLLADRLAPEKKKASAHNAAGTAPSAEEISRYSGLYWNRETDDLLRVEGKDGKLFLRQGEDNQNELQRVGPGRFRVPEAPISVEVRFTSAGAGVPARMEIVYEDDDSSLLEKVEETSPSSEALPAYAGVYENEELETKFTLRFEKGRLMLHRRGADDAPLKPLFTDAFQDEGIGLLRFLREGSRVTGFEVSAGGTKVRFVRRGA